MHLNKWARKKFGENVTIEKYIHNVGTVALFIATKSIKNKKMVSVDKTCGTADKISGSTDRQGEDCESSFICCPRRNVPISVRIMSASSAFGVPLQSNGHSSLINRPTMSLEFFAEEDNSPRPSPTASPSAVTRWMVEIEINNMQFGFGNILTLSWETGFERVSAQCLVYTTFTGLSTTEEYWVSMRQKILRRLRPPPSFYYLMTRCTSKGVELLVPCPTGTIGILSATRFAIKTTEYDIALRFRTNLIMDWRCVQYTSF